MILKNLSDKTSLDHTFPFHQGFISFVFEDFPYLSSASRSARALIRRKIVIQVPDTQRTQSHHTYAVTGREFKKGPAHIFLSEKSPDRTRKA